jgi:hypothetical protein
MFAMVFSSRSFIFTFFLQRSAKENLRHYWAAPSLSQEDQSGNPVRGALRKQKTLSRLNCSSRDFGICRPIATLTLSGLIPAAGHAQDTCMCAKALNKKEKPMALDAPRATGPSKLAIRNIGLLLSGALEKPILDADTIVAVNGKITAIGRTKDVDTEGATTLVDANGTTAAPGLIDGHIYPANPGRRRKNQILLTSARG